MTIQEKAAYVKGLADGMNLDTSKPEGKLLSELIALLGEVTEELKSVQEAYKNLVDYVEELDEDLADVEDYLCADDEDEDWDDDDEDDDEDEDEEWDDEPYFYEAVCPACGDTVCFDDSIDPENVTCPNCGEVFICEFECDGECEGCTGCDDVEETEESAE